MFSLEKLNDNNYNELSKLKINKKQQEYVLNFDKCIKYKEKYPFLQIYGIKKDNTYIGLTAFARWDSDDNIPIEDRWTWFDEFFLDEHYQGKGYATEIVNMILNKIKEIYHPKFIVLSVKNENEIAKKLYHKIGFKDTHLIYDDKHDEVKRKKQFDLKDEFIMFYDC